MEKTFDLNTVLEEYLEMWFDIRGNEIENTVGVGGHLGVIDFVKFVKEIEDVSDNSY